jgi:transposase
MFIRQTRTNNKATGEGYFTFRLVRGERIAGKVRQITILNLGRHFPLAQDDWPLLCSRLEQLLNPQALLCSLSCSDKIERAAQRYYQQLIERAPTAAVRSDAPGTGAVPASGGGQPDTAATPNSQMPAATPVQAATPANACAAAPDMQNVDIDSLALTQPRSVGVEHVALHAIAQLGLIEKLTALGINAVGRACIVGNLIARMAAPASELASWEWLQANSALGELLDVDFCALSHMRLYRASDALMHHRDTIETHVFGAVTTLFAIEETVTLYDLTNTYFEGPAERNDKAEYGHSKEKRSDCPLVTLGLVLDGSGFVRRSKTFEGNINEGPTLQVMLSGLKAPPGALVIMDAGIATQANIDWLIAHKYRYLVVRRGGMRQFDASQSVATWTAGGEIVKLQKTTSVDGKEVDLYCHSTGRQAKEVAMVERFCKRFEAGLQKIADGLTSERGEKNADKLLQRIGQLKAKSHGISQHYTITLETKKTDVPDVPGTPAAPETPETPETPELTLRWTKQYVQGTMASHPGVYCLRTNLLDWDAQKLWQTYSTLTDVESVFRSFKGELGLRPVFHQNENRADGHLFITVLAYQCVQVIRKTLKAHGINDSWTSLRNTLSVQQRITASMQRSDGRTIHVRKATKPEPALTRIYNALGISTAPGGIKKLVV